MGLAQISYLEAIRRFREERADDVGGDLAPIIGYTYPWLSPTIDPFLKWSGSQVLHFLNDARTEFTARRPIRDTGTMAVVAGQQSYPYSISVTVGLTTYTFDISVMAIRQIVLASNSTPLKKLTTWQLDDWLPNWRKDRGKVQFYREDGKARVIDLVRIPCATDTLLLTFDRQVRDEPAADHITDLMTEPDPAYIEQILDWMAFLAFSKRDSETYNQARADTYYAKFEREVGPKLDAGLIRARLDLAGTFRRTEAQYR